MIERIYIAAPYMPRESNLHDAARIAQRNVDRAIEAANCIHDKGHYAFVPHLTHYLHIHYSCLVDRGVWYYDYDNTFLDHWATSFLYLAPSYGADLELDRAIKLGLKIYYNLDEILEAR
jgi:hypothetical protein